MYVLKNWIKEFLSLFVFLRFHNMMELYEYLCKTRKETGICASVFSYMCEKKGCYIGYFAEFANRPYFPHGLHGIFISGSSKIGKNAVIYQQVTIGAVRTKGSKNIGNPTIGDNCYIGAGAKIIGNIKIGNNVRIGANACVYKDVPDNSIVVCSPTRIISGGDEPLDNRFYVLENNGTVTYYENGRFIPTDDKDVY